MFQIGCFDLSFLLLRPSALCSHLFRFSVNKHDDDDDGQWTVDSGQWTVGSGQWTVDSGQWTVDSGQWTVDSAVDRSGVPIRSWRNEAPC